MQRPGAIVGQKGVKYGLQSRQQPKPQQQAQPAGGRLAAFGGDSDSDEEGVGAQVARQAARKVADSKVRRHGASWCRPKQRQRRLARRSAAAAAVC